MTNVSRLDIFKLLNVDGIGNRKINRIIRHAVGSGFDFDTFRELESRKMHSLFPFLSESDCAAIRGVDTEPIIGLYDAIREKMVDDVSIESNLYPQHLSEKLKLDSPPLLLCYGDVSIMDRPGAAVVGSRHASEEAIRITIDIVNRLSGGSFPLISGGAQGVDMAGHRAALENGMKTVVVLASGIQEFMKRSASGFPTEQAVAVSQFHPLSAWRPALAMIRNKVVCALSKALIVIEAGPKGGTLDAGKCALSMQLPLYVVDPNLFQSPPPGNIELIRLGGTAIAPDGSRGIVI